MKDREIEEFMKVMGVSDEDIAKITPEMENRLKKVAENTAKYRLVFEVVKSKNCLAGVQVGQKIVTDAAMIDTAASDCPLCMGIVGVLLPLNLVFYDRCINGDLTAPMPEGVRCSDPGLECPEVNGLGTVIMNARIEPKA